jgi:hypothetical protein
MVIPFLSFDYYATSGGFNAHFFAKRVAPVKSVSRLIVLGNRNREPAILVSYVHDNL